MWDILRLPHWIFHVDLCFEDEYNIVLRIHSIGFLCSITRDSWVPRLREYGSEIGFYLGFEIGSSVERFWDHLLGLHLKSQSTQYFAWHLEIIFVHMNKPWLEFHMEHCISWLLLLEKSLWLIYHWDFHLDNQLNIQILELCCMKIFFWVHLGLWFQSEAVRYWWSCHRLTYFRRATWKEVNISCFPFYGFLIPSNINSIR